MVDGDLEGMCTFDSQIERLVKEGFITERDALSYVTNQNNLALKLSELADERVRKTEARRKTHCVKSEWHATGLELNGITDNILDLFER